MFPSKIKDSLVHLSLILSLIGIFFFTYYSLHFGPLRISNNFIPLWLCLSIFIFSIVQSDLKNHYFLKCFLIISATIITISYYLAQKTCETFISGYFAFFILTNFLLSKCISPKEINIKAHQPINSQSFNLEMSWISTNYAPLDSNRKKSIVSKSNNKLLMIIFFILKLLLTIMMLFQMFGSLIIGGLTIVYPPRGVFLDVPISNSGEIYKTHVLCTEVGNSSLPTVLIEGDFSHGLADYLGLQSYLTDMNISSCIWDKPGLGYSDELFIDHTNLQDFYHNFISQINKRPPFIFVGWGGGGQIIYQYAHEHPENVKSLLFLDVSPERIEWTTPKILKNWTQQEYDDQVNNDMKNRENIINTIQMIGVPFGIMKLFFPNSPSYPLEYNNEREWYFLTDKTWATQSFFMEQLPYIEDPLYSYNISEEIKVNLIMTAWKNETIVEKCKENKLDVNSTECKYNIDSNYYDIMEKKKLNKNNGRIIECNETECNLGYYIYGNPLYTAKTIYNIYYQ